MSTRDDARLTAQERAALASLEAMAAAEDPELALRLKGPSRLRLAVHLPRIPAWARSKWWGVPLALLGLTLVLLSLSLAWALGLLGAVLTTAGLLLAASELNERWVRSSSSPPVNT